MANNIVPIIMINIIEPIQAGPIQMIPRVTLQQRNTINQAAAAIGMSQGEFMRTVLVKAAEFVLQESGVKVVEPT